MSRSRGETIMARLVCVVVVPQHSSKLSPATRRSLFDQVRRADGLRVAAGGRPFAGTGLASVHDGAAKAADSVLGGIVQVCRDEVLAGRPDACVVALANGVVPPRDLFRRLEASLGLTGEVSSVTPVPTLEGGWAVRAADGAWSNESDDTDIPATVASFLQHLRVVSADVSDIRRTARDRRFDAAARKAAARSEPLSGGLSDEEQERKARSATIVLAGIVIGLLLAASVTYLLLSPARPATKPSQTYSLAPGLPARTTR